MIKISDLPKYDQLMWPTLITLEKIGGSASGNEINDAVIEQLALTSEMLDLWYDSGAGPVIPHRLSWARTYLKSAGYLTSGGRGIWLITDAGRGALKLNEKSLKAAVKAAQKARKSEPLTEINLTDQLEPNDASVDPGANHLDWHDKLLVVLKAMDPSAFERLAQRLLRESGFVKVEVTGKTGDGGIDGTGILQISLMSFHVLFQCKRYQGSVGSGAVRDFRGAMMGRTDKGLIITTGTFSPDARREATRDGAPPIDLIDGAALCEKLKELSLGVETKLVEEIAVKPAWFEQL